MYMLAVPESFQQAWRGDPTAVDPAALVVTADQQQAVLEFCEDYGITFTGEPGWYLTSYWG